MKKFIALLLTIALLAAEIFALPVYAEDEENTIVITEDAITLAELGVIGNAEELAANKTLTRAEFAIVLANALGGNSDVPAMYFSDVDENNSAYGAVSKLVSEGIVHGKSDGIFGPDTTITYYEAIKMVICALGYSDLAEARGGYTIGYIQVANSLGLPKGSGAVSGGLAAELILEMLNTETAEINGINKSGSNSYTGSGETLMKQRLDIYEVKGQLTENYATALSGDTGIESGYAVIGKDVYKIDDIDADKYLGYNIIAYAKDVEPNPEILSIKINKNRNNVLEVLGDDIDGYKTTKTSLVYYKNDTETTAKISPVADVIYNGQATITSYTADDFCPQNGFVTLIDTDNDKVYDVVKITDYKNVFLGNNLTEAADAFCDLNDNSIAFSIDKKKNIVSVIKGETGEKAAITDLIENTLVSVAQAKDMGYGRRFITIVINSETVSGTISSKGKDYAVIDGTKYEIAKDYRGDELSLNYTADFYLDNQGKIAASTAGSDSDLMYGMIYGVAEEKKGLDTTLMVKILTTGGEFETFNCSDKFKINGNKVETVEEALGALRPTRYLPYGYAAAVAQTPSLAYRDDEIKQVIKYKKNADGEVTNIYTAIEENENILSVDAPLDKRASKNDNASFGKLYLEFFYNSNTYFLLFPDVSADYATRNEEKQYSFVKGASSVSIDTSGSTQAVEAYDIDDGGYAKVILKEEVAGSVTDISSADYIALVGDITEVWQNDGIRNGISVWNAGAEKSLILKEDADADVVNLYNTLESGDIIRYHLNRFGEIENMQLILDLSEFNFDIYNAPFLAGSRGGTYQQQVRIIFGGIYRIYKSSTMVATPDVDKLIAGDYDNMNIEYQALGKVGAITIFNRSKGEMRRGTVAELANYVYSVNKNARVVYQTGMGFINGGIIIYE